MDPTEPETERHAHLEQVIIAATRARSLVGQILEFSNPERTDFECVDANAIISEVADMLRPALPPHVDISWICARPA